MSRPAATQRSPLNRPGVPSYTLLAGLAQTPHGPPRAQVSFSSHPSSAAAAADAEQHAALDDSLAEEHRIALAACFVRAAMTSGRPISHKRTTEALASLAFYFSALFQLCLWTALLALVGLAFFEDGPLQLPGVVTYSVEAFCLGFLLLAALEEQGFMGKAYLRESVCVFHATVLLLVCMEFLMTFLHPPGAATFRYARSLRPLLILKHAPRMRERLVDIFRVGWGARMPIALLYLNLLLFSMFAITLFHGTPEGFEHFATIGDALTTMIILQTTCNSPGVLMPAFATDRASSLFFVLFLIVSHFLLINLILGAVYNVHKEHLLRSAARELMDERVAARCALAALCDDIGTGRGSDVAPFGLVVDMLVKKFGFQERAAADLVRRIGGSSEMGVPRAVFNDLPMAVQLRMVGAAPVHEEDETWLQRAFAAQVDLMIFGRVNVVIFLVTATLLSSILATIYFLFNDLDEVVEREPRDLFAINSLITVAFVLEMVGKLRAWGAARFADDPWNLFDLLLVLVSFVGLVAGLLGWISVQTALLLRDARLLRLVRVVPAFRVLTGTAWAFAPAAAPFFGAAACVFYSTAIFTVGVLGDVRLAPEDYRGNDFRDFAAALLTLFELAVVNDWNLTMKAFVAATGTKQVRFFFVAWWSVSFLLLFNSVTSLILEGFDSQIKGKLTDDSHAVVLRRSRSASLLNMDDAKTSSSFTLSKLFVTLFRSLEEPSEQAVDRACWEAGVHVGSRMPESSVHG